MKKVLVISTSPRKGGNSEVLADEFIKGAIDGGNNIAKICLYDKQIGFCKGCFACQKTQKCIIDDAGEIMQKMHDADVIVFATPIYFYEMCGQMKTLIDRTNPLYNSKYKFREIYLIATAADTNPASMDGAIKGLEGWIECFDKSKLCGVIKALGVTNIGDIRKQTKTLREAYEMGKSI